MLAAAAVVERQAVVIAGGGSAGGHANQIAAEVQLFDRAFAHHFTQLI
jgi:hypothetical protein